MKKLKKIVLIIVIIAIIVLTSIGVGKLIGKSLWIVFFADFVFFYLLVLLFTEKYELTTSKGQIVGISSVVLAILLVLATIGCSITTSPHMLWNVIILITGGFICAYIALMKMLQ